MEPGWNLTHHKRTETEEKGEPYHEGRKIPMRGVASTRQLELIEIVSL
jgi:hypothetical protein